MRGLIAWSMLAHLRKMRWVGLNEMRNHSRSPSFQEVTPDIPLIFVSAENVLKSCRALLKCDISKRRPSLNSWIWLATILSDDSIVPILFLKREFSFLRILFAAANCSFYRFDFWNFGTPGKFLSRKFLSRRPLSPTSRETNRFLFDKQLIFLLVYICEYFPFCYK